MRIVKADFCVKVVGLNCLEAHGVFGICLFGFFEQVYDLLKLIFLHEPVGWCLLLDTFRLES